MTSCFEYTVGFCDADLDEDGDDEIDFCGIPSDQIVEIAIRRDFLLLQLQALVDADSLEDAERAVRAMEKETRADGHKLRRFLVRAGTVEIIESNEFLCPKRRPDGAEADGEAAPPRSRAAVSLLKKLAFHHEQQKLRELKKKQRGSWTKIIYGSS